MSKGKRGDRRARTLRVSTARRRCHLRNVHGGDPSQVDCVCELARFYFAKRKPLACDCRRPKRGRPRLDTGICHWSWRKRIYETRRLYREQLNAIVSGRTDSHDDEVGQVDARK